MADRWQAALAEHARVLDDFADVAARFTDDSWTRAPSVGRWSAAALTLHVADAYRFGASAAAGGPGMRLRVPMFAAFVSRTVIFPAMLWLRRFPREAPAPAEVRPDLELANTLTRQEVLARLRADADRAVAALLRPDASRVVHAYFGSLSPHQTLRLLTAHTRHHTDGLRERLAGAAA